MNNIGRGFTNKKGLKGFTLVEVIVALTVFFVAVIYLLGGYYSYYGSVKQLNYKAIGQSLAQFELEDLRNFSMPVLDSLVKGGYYPTGLTYSAPNYPHDTNTNPAIYDSGKVDTSYRIEHITKILNVENSESLPELILPNSIEIQPVLQTDLVTGYTYYDYTIILHKEVFPHYYRRVVIVDKTPGISSLSNKIYEITVTIYWSVNGVEKNVTVTTLKSAKGS
ncbi:MAG: prepilin-type N-terminal cleavage/methylation domain-containing protein [Caldisericaceae bacterium]